MMRISLRGSGKQGQPIPLETVLQLFKDLNGVKADKAIEKRLRGFKVWELLLWTNELAGQAKIWYDPCIPVDHPGHILTNYGREQTLTAVVKNWTRASRDCGETYQVKATLHYIAALKNNEVLPPIVAVRGRIDRAIYILDGNTRVLAAEILKHENPGFVPKLEVCLGRKSFFQVP